MYVVGGTFFPAMIVGVGRRIVSFPARIEGASRPISSCLDKVGGNSFPMRITGAGRPILSWTDVSMLLMSVMRDINPMENARQVTAISVTTRNLGEIVMRYGRSCVLKQDDASSGVELDPTDDVSGFESDPVDLECGLAPGLGPAFDSWAGGDISPAVDATLPDSGLATKNLL